MRKIYTLALLTVLSVVTALPIAAAEKNKGELSMLCPFFGRR